MYRLIGNRMNKQSEGFFFFFSFLVPLISKLFSIHSTQKLPGCLITQIPALPPGFYDPECTWLFLLTARLRSAEPTELNGAVVADQQTQRGPRSSDNIHEQLFWLYWESKPKDSRRGGRSATAD